MIYPGYISGSVCGIGLSGKPTSTMAFERRWNPMLSLDRDTFVESSANVPAKPADMEQFLAFNRGHADVKAHA
jgi:hydroxyacylglutathione hydrolase